MPHRAVERRIHRVFVTRNSEYYVSQQICVGVRDRQTGEWLPEHFAVERPVLSSIRFFDNGAMRVTPGLPRVGEALYFEELGRDLVTSPVVSVERPRGTETLAKRSSQVGTDGR
jgi:hypothetical protein